jgi:glycosyltransferase involved in cell wall biosynthesis
MEKNPNISFLTFDWSWGTKPLQPNGCGWYRCLLPSRELKKHQWGTGMGFPGFNESFGFGLMVEDEKAIHGWDIIVFKLIMHQRVLEEMHKAKAMGQIIVVDIDDWHDGLEKTNRAYDVTDPEKSPENNRDIYNKIIALADAIVVSTPFLGDYYSKFNDNVFMVRNGIDLDRWKRNKVNFVDKPTIGWVGATPWRSSDLESVADSVGSFINSNGLKFHHSGHLQTNAAHAADQLGISADSTTTLPLVPILDYPKLFAPIDIGIVPLNDVQFNHAKSFIKGLEYVAAGIPFISSWSPEYEFMASYGVGRVARNKSEWDYHLNELMDPSMRKDEVEENLANVKNLFTMEKRGAEWNHVYRSILEGAENA